MKLFVDDIRKPPEGWTLVKSYKKTISLLRTNTVTEISIDHDLGSEQGKTGYDILLWIENEIINTKFIPPKIYIHSNNVVGKQRMETAVNSIKKLTKSC